MKLHQEEEEVNKQLSVSNFDNDNVKEEGKDPVDQEEFDMEAELSASTESEVRPHEQRKKAFDYY